MSATPVEPASDTLLIGADGTSTFIDKDWHEVKVGVVAPLGWERKTDPDTGHPRLVVGENAYCAFSGNADDSGPMASKRCCSRSPLLAGPLRGP